MIHTLLPSALIGLTMLLTPLAGCAETPVVTSSPSKVEIVQNDKGYQLHKNGEAYTILGVGGSSNLQLLKAYGGNTVRTWDAEGIEPMMDEAAQLGISVVVGIWLEHGRHGFDYNDPSAKAKELARVEQFVKQFKDHPALLAWGVGNEVELGASMEMAIQQINDASAMIKSLDPNHPTMAVIAEIGDDKAIRIQNECPHIDMLGINSYGGLGSLSRRVTQQGVTLPYAITEFGPLGHWESGNSPWGAPYEQSSNAKAQFLKNNYTQTIKANLGKQCLGSFAFLWGEKQEKTATWYGLLLKTGETTESVDVLSEFWTGEKPDNMAPRVRSMSLDVDPGKLKSGQEIKVTIDARDPDKDTLTTVWQLIPESGVQSAGGDHEDSIEPVEITIREISPTVMMMTVPERAGAFRIFATVRDGQGHAGTVNLPVMIAP